MKYITGVVAIDNVSWTPVSSEIDCLRLVLTNNLADDIKIRTDDADPLTQIMLTMLAQKVFDAPRNSIIMKNGVLCYAQLVSGTGNLTRECVY